MLSVFLVLCLGFLVLCLLLPAQPSHSQSFCLKNRKNKETKVLRFCIPFPYSISFSLEPGAGVLAFRDFFAAVLRILKKKKETAAAGRTKQSPERSKSQKIQLKEQEILDQATAHSPGSFLLSLSFL